jgi:putative phosphoribosyl transferase
MSNLVEDRTLRNKRYVFENRAAAGRKLSQMLLDFHHSDVVVLAIPSGGVPVAIEMRKGWPFQFDLLIVRKVQIPWDTEAGFGAVNLDGEVILNEELLRSLRLSQDLIEAQIERTKEILKKRDQIFRRGRDFPPIKSRIVILVDDGLASGYSMIAAIQFVKKRDPSKIVVGVPTGSYGTLLKISPLADALYCLNVREGFPFAVAEAYSNWYDLSDEEVLGLLDFSQ